MSAPSSGAASDKLEKVYLFFCAYLTVTRTRSSSSTNFSLFPPLAFHYYYYLVFSYSS